LKARGFTLVELVMTLIIVGILAVAVLPRFDLLKGFDEIGYRDKVRSTLEFARKAAVAQRRKVCVQLAGNDLTLTIDNQVPETSNSTCDATTSLERDLDLPAPDRACGGATNQVCHPTGVTLAATSAAISISPLGQPSAGVTYTVTGEAAHTISVEAETGYVH